MCENYALLSFHEQGERMRTSTPHHNEVSSETFNGINDTLKIITIFFLESFLSCLI